MAITRRSFCATVPLSLAAVLPAQRGKPRRRRADCFFGLHFDLHPGPLDTALGRDVTDGMVESFLTTVKPDFVQYDCKGHIGYLGYPSKVSTSAPGIVNDSLAVWRQATARHGVPLYIHFSGVLDQLAVEQRPEWARIGPDGKRAERETSTFSAYVDERMIPQLKEAIAGYDLDGAWVDGECWGTNPDYSEAAARAFREETGISPLPKGPKDNGWLPFLEFNRRRFRRYVKHYVDTLHRFRPGVEMASNWLYSTYVPEPPDLPVDFISGDYLGNASISRARLEARYISAVGKPWDLMAWGFQSGRNNPVGPIHKPAVQLQQEACVVLAQGGGFQIYYQPSRAGKLDPRHVNVMARVAEFCRARQALSHKTEPVPEVGVIFSTRSLYNTSNKLFGGWGARSNPANGILDALIEAHYSVDVVPEWKLKDAASSYPLLVLPDWPDAGGEVKDILLARVRAGGSLIIIGAENARLFETDLDVRLQGAARDQPAYVEGAEVFGNVRGLWQDVETGSARAIEMRYPTWDSSRDGKCAATLTTTAGSGKIAAIYGPIGQVFAVTHSPDTRAFVDRVVRRVFEPSFELEGPPTIEAALRRKGGRLLLHLSNATAMQAAGEYAALDFVPPIGPLKLKMRLPARPRKVTWEPEGRTLKGEWKDGVYRTDIERLEVHGVVAIELW